MTIIEEKATRIPLYTRFRMVAADAKGECRDQPLSPTGYAETGEVENYRWGWKPSAVTLQGLSSVSSTDDNSMLLLLSVMGLGSLLTLLWIARRRRVQS